MIKTTVKSLSKWLLLPFLMVVFLQAQQVGAIEKASHIIRGTVEKTENEMAGGLVPITHVYIRVDKIFKDSDNGLTEGGTIKILLYGMETGSGIIASADHELTYLKTEHQIIVPLIKNHDNYLLFEPGDPFRLAYVNSNNVAGFDEEGLRSLDPKNRNNHYYIKQQREFEKQEPGRKNSLNKIYAQETNQLLKETNNDFGAVDTYEGMLSNKADFCALKAARKAPIIASVKVVSVTSLLGSLSESKLAVEVLEILKGNLSGKKVSVNLPPGDYLKQRGWGLPQEGQIGIILLNNSLHPTGFPDFFIAEKDGELAFGKTGKMTKMEFYRTIIERKQ